MITAPLSVAAARTDAFRYCICNETFAGSSFEEACRIARKTGFTGVEIAPGTVGGDPVKISPSERTRLRRIMDAEGVQYAGLHSLMPADPALHLTTPDEATRKRSWDFFRRLIDLSGDLGGGVMVLGSGKQRAAINDATPAEAKKRLRDGLAACADHAASRRVLLLLEPLSPQFTNVVNTMGEAVAVVREIGHAAVSSMFDTHNTTAETEPHDQVISRHRSYIRHVHVNEMDGRHPGTGSYDFARVLKALRAVNYGGWISVEVFDFRPSGEVIAAESMALLRRAEQQLKGGDPE
jgi:sugar phosphate isomerase/epimerase